VPKKVSQVTGAHGRRIDGIFQMDSSILTPGKSLVYTDKRHVPKIAFYFSLVWENSKSHNSGESKHITEKNREDKYVNISNYSPSFPHNELLSLFCISFPVSN
jgi:hypothetical protein